MLTSPSRLLHYTFRPACTTSSMDGVQYDETTWSARTWRSFAVQRIGVAVQCAVAFELRDACGMSFAGDPRGALGCGV